MAVLDALEAAGELAEDLVDHHAKVHCVGLEAGLLDRRGNIADAHGLALEDTSNGIDERDAILGPPTTATGRVGFFDRDLRLGGFFGYF